LLNVEGEIENLARIEAKINGLRLAEAADEKTSDNQQHQ